MINEVAEVQAYLRGENIIKHNLYRICYLILKWYKEQGYDKLQAREALFEWGTKNKIYIEYRVNSMISYIWGYDNKPLSAVEYVYVSDWDIKEIDRRFDRKRVKIIAFALLCYGKVHADENGEFSLSLDELAAWTGLSKSSISKSYLPELADFKYISMINPKGAFHKYGKALSFRTRFKLLVPFENKGRFLADNNIVRGFNELF